MSELQSLPKSVGTLFFLILLSLAPVAYSQQTPLSLTISMDRAQYVQGDTITISGRVLDGQNNPVEGASVSIQVGDPPVYSNLIITDNSGAFNDSFIISTSVPPGQITVYATASKSGYTTTQQQVQFTLLQETTSTTSSSAVSTTSSTSQPSSKCFIATATYGSEIAPEVALLRHFRDAEVLQTSAGRGFMLAFNAFYYSFSPQIAIVISSHDTLRTAMKVILYPLIGILYFSNIIFQRSTFNSEIAVTLAGMFASFGIGVVYFGPLTILGRRFIRTKRDSFPLVRWGVLGSCAISILGITIGEAGGSEMLLTVASVATVLSFASSGALSIVSLVAVIRRQRTVALGQQSCRSKMI